MTNKKAGKPAGPTGKEITAAKKLIELVAEQDGDWSAAMKKMAREEPELWKPLQNLLETFIAEGQAELERLAAGPEAADPRTGGTAVPAAKVPILEFLDDPGRRV